MTTLEPFHAFWQELLPPSAAERGAPVVDRWPAALPDGRVIELPIRVLPGDGSLAVASLIMNQASFEVVDALADAVAAQLRPLDIDLVVAVPTLGLPFAESIARRLGHRRMLALGTSRKFWYDDALSEPLSSITSPDLAKRLYLDPRMLPLLEGRRVALVDDVASSGRSLVTALRLLARVDADPVAIAVAMLQTDAWRAALDALDPSLPGRVRTAISSPLLRRLADGTWSPA